MICLQFVHAATWLWQCLQAQVVAMPPICWGQVLVVIRACALTLDARAEAGCVVVAAGQRVVNMLPPLMIRAW